VHIFERLSQPTTGGSLVVRIFFAFGLAVASLLFFTNRADSDQLLKEKTGVCNGIDDCLLVLDNWSKTYNGRIEDVSVAVMNLKRFGEPMRRALLDRGVDADLRSRQLADLLLSAWGGWTKDDVPELAKVLASKRRRYYGSHGQECAGPAAIVHGPAADPPAWNSSSRQFHGFLVDSATHLDSRSLQDFGDQFAAGTAERPKEELER
jgi:hypothetical protein